MNRLGELLGSATRGNILEALALSDKPLTAYRIAKTYNMNIAKVYLEMKRLDGLGVIRKAERNRGVEYEMGDGDVKNLVLRLSSRVLTYESWRSQESKRARFRMGFAQIPRFSMAGAPRGARSGTRRTPGELENLATLGRKKFDSKYRLLTGRNYARL